ncbi:MAG TPA: DUF2726 domain-containing protein [Niabella sp.]|nr:DUF2726 domain-containing protein [Niabella sp.]
MELLIAALVLVILLTILFPKNRKSRTAKKYGSWRKITPKVEEPWKPVNPRYAPPPDHGLPKEDKAEEEDTSKALKIALSNKYEKQRLYNKTEEEVFKLLIQLIYTHAKGQYKVNGQTSLGELLKTNNKYAFNVVNYKRVDFCIVDREYMPIAVIEVNGTGHYQNNALERDEIKRAACESAGIKYVAIRENESKKEKLERELLSLLKIPAKSAALKENC